MRGKYILIFLQLIVVASLVTITTGCAPLVTRNPVVRDKSQNAHIPDIPLARFWGDELPSRLKKRLENTREEIKASFPETFGKPHNYLSVSGGGANGAFGAGLLVGWTEAGNRPKFDIVTGISTGALIAPFAFLGPSYDQQLQEIYTTLSTKDLLKRRSLLKLLRSDSIANSEPFRGLIAKYINEQILEQLADAYKKGRRLFIGTTNLDADRPVIWDVTAIAASGAPNALDLIHDVLLASASIPGAFPPVYIEVEADGERYDEMHVDGGVTSQVFLYPVSVDWRQVMELLEVKGTPQVYVIRNARLLPNYKITDPKLLPIAERSISSLIRTQGVGDLYRIYLGTQRDGVGYNLAYIPDYVDLTPKEQFDPHYMQILFDLGYKMAKSGYPWKKQPPGFDPL